MKPWKGGRVEEVYGGLHLFPLLSWMPAPCYLRPGHHVPAIISYPGSWQNSVLYEQCIRDDLVAATSCKYPIQVLWARLQEVSHHVILEETTSREAKHRPTLCSRPWHFQVLGIDADSESRRTSSRPRAWCNSNDVVWCCFMLFQHVSTSFTVVSTFSKFSWSLHWMWWSEAAGRACFCVQTNRGELG